MMVADPPHRVAGWDIGGAHLKGALVEHGRVREVSQWPCELWRGLPELTHAFERAFLRSSAWRDAMHAVTMTGEMADLFEHREAGVAAIVSHAVASLGERTSFYAGDAGFVDAPGARGQWHGIASANWLATASIVARSEPDALVVDVGSTTTDIVPIEAGRVAAAGCDDASRLASGELVYVGVVRTPLCALARTVPFGSRETNVMNELFATTADVFRLTGDLRPEHDQAPAADQGTKDTAATMRRLARMIGRDARDAPDDDWRAFAQVWRRAMIDCVGTSMARVAGRASWRNPPVVVGAGCGSFIARELAAGAGLDYVGFEDVVRVEGDWREWARTCAPSVAVALLRAEADRCGS